MASDPLATRLYLELGVRVRRAREAKGMKQDELATEVGVSRSSIANIERGRQHAPVHLLFILAETLGVDVGHLLPTRHELVTLVDASRDVPKFVNIGGESRLMSGEMVQLVGELLTTPTRAKTASRRGRSGNSASPRKKGGASKWQK